MNPSTKANPVKRRARTKTLRQTLQTVETQGKATQQAIAGFRQTIADFREAFKKLHMESVGTQNDLLKFKDDIVLQLIKFQNEVHEAREKTFTREDGKRLFQYLDTSVLRLDSYARNARAHDLRLGELEARLSRLKAPPIK